MKICMVGSGYVGLVSGAGFAETGNDVVCADVDEEKIRKLEQGIIPIFEPGLDELVARNVAHGRLRFTTDVASAVRGAQAIFVGVGTPQRSDGAADLSAVDAVAQVVAEHADRECVLVCKSTVPVGTNARVRRLVAEAKVKVHVVSNPEFLKEGAAVNDFLRPDRIVVGVDPDDTFARDVMTRLYHPLCLDRDRMVWMDPASAELTKYVANTMLAMRISFMNEVAALCEKVGADIHKVRHGVGSDERIGPKFLYSGPGYGGSCLAGKESVLVRRGDALELTALEALFTREHGAGDDTPTALAIAPEGLEVAAWDPAAQRCQLRPVSALTRRPYEGELLEVRTTMGRRVTCTPDHPFVARRGYDGPTEVVLARDLTEEHWLPLGRGAIDGVAAAEVAAAEVGSLDLLAWLPRTSIPREDVIVRLAGDDLAKLRQLDVDGVLSAIAPLGHPRGRERARDIVGSGAMRLPEADLLGFSLEDATFGTAKNGTYLPRHIPMDAHFWRVVGLYLSEGHISADGARRRLFWSFHPTREPHLVDEITSFWARFDVKTAVRQGTTATHVSVSSRLLAALWTEVLELGADCYSHAIPSLAWAQPEAHKKALLAGLWWGDGSWSYVSGGPSVVLEYGTASRSLADGMLRLLGELDLMTRQKIGRAAKSTVDTHWFVLSGADQIERALFLVDERSAETIRASVAQQQKRIAPTGYRREAEGSAWVRVSKIRPAAPERFVYSLEVPGPETVVTTGGLVVHNCFPKDVKALVHTARDHGLEIDLAVATDKVNQRQKGLLFRKLKQHFDGDLRGKRIALWGLAFKPRTDDLRESPALTLIDALLADGAVVHAHDPEAEANARAHYGDRIVLHDDAYTAAKDAEALVLVTEWRQYQNPDFERLKQLMTRPVLLDGRNIWSEYGTRAMGFTYDSIGAKGS